MKRFFWFLPLVLFFSFGWASDSITGWDITYREMCLKAATDSWYFQNFRSLSDYTHALEIFGGGPFAEFLKNNASKDTLKKLPLMQKLDEIGNPSTSFYPGVGRFSGTTLRYIVIADHIKRMFNLPKHAKICEIGAGFGGQCYILSQLLSFSDYYIYDLPEAEALIEKMLTTLKVSDVTCLPLEKELPEGNIDLVISNYAFSECGLDIQLEYFDRVIKKSVRGYMIYNQIAETVFNLNYLSPDKFVELLEKNGLHPQVLSEPIMTYEGNLLIVWDKTR